MSHSHNSWGPEPNHPPRTTQADTLQQSFRLPPPSSLVYSAPSDSERVYTHPPGQYSRQGAPHQRPVGSRAGPPPASYTHVPPSNPYHSTEHNANSHLRSFHTSQAPLYHPPPIFSDPQVGEVLQERSEHSSQPTRHDQQPPRAVNTQPSSYQWQNSAPAGMGIGQSTFRTAAPPSSVSPSGLRSKDLPNLLGEDKAQVVGMMKFHLSMRQQPKAARACGSGERDRRNIDPPPIVQLHVDAPGLTKEDINKYLRYEGYVMNCWIYDETGTHDASHMPSEYRYQRRLTGSLVGTPFYGKDERGQEGCFFPFSDLSVRTLGKYRLKFNLIMLDTTRPGKSKHFPILAEIFSDVFDVYTAKEFPGINESSKLVRTLREQGCIISIKKGNDRKKRPKETEDQSDDEDEVNDDAGSMQGKRKRSLTDG